MSVKATLLIDGIETNILTYDFSFRQEMDANNRPKAIPKFGGITVTIESQKVVHLAAWAIAHNQTKQLQLIISPVTQTGKTRTLFLFDCHLVGWYNRFSSTGTNPKTETLNITCGGVREDNDTLEYSAPWRTTFDVPPPESSEEEEEEELEPSFIGAHFEDENGEPIEQSMLKNNQSFYLVIETKDAAGESITINLDDDNLDYEYNNQAVENDTLQGVSITGDITKVKLTAIKAQ